MSELHYVQLQDGMVLRTDDPGLWPEAKKLGRAEGKRLRREYAIKQLRGLLSEGDTVWTVLRHVSASGMMRHIDVYAIRENEPRYLSSFAADALEWRMAERGIKVSGCGMDMGFHLVDSLGHALKLKLHQRWL
jgi:hypothetical protein